MKLIPAYFLIASLVLALGCVTACISQDGRNPPFLSERAARFLEKRRAGSIDNDTPEASLQNLIPLDQQKLTTWETLQHDGRERYFAVFVPPSVKRSGAKVPLVIDIHGGGGNAGYAMKSSQFNEKAIKEGFIVVYPEGTGPMKHLFLTWNCVHCCGPAMKNKVDDVGFISKMIDKLGTEYPIDLHRVYACGLSNGGMMSHKLGIDLSNKIAAIGPVVSTLFGDEKRPPRAVPAIIFNGAQDENVHIEGGLSTGRFAQSWDPNCSPQKIEVQAQFWSKTNGGSDKPTKIEETATTKHFHFACPSNNDVELFIVKDQGHAWPGGLQGGPKGDMPSKSVHATDLMWDFFKQHSR